MTHEKFICKKVSKVSHEVVIDQIRQEITVLEACQKIKRVVKLIDVIEDTQSITVILEHFEDMSLRQILDLGSKIDLDYALDLLNDISCMVQALHKQRVSHRKLTLDSFRVKLVGNTFKLIVAGFD